MALAPYPSAEPCDARPPFLDKMVISHRAAGRKFRRSYHRIISGLQRPGRYRLLTLTSSPEAPPDINHSWDILCKRLRRRGLVKAYIKVVEFTKAGRPHIHCLFRGSYIEQSLLSEMWASIHNSPIIDIRQVHASHRDRQASASYLSKYLCKASVSRLSPSNSWLFPRATVAWQALCHAARSTADYRRTTPNWQLVLSAWQTTLAAGASLTYVLGQLGLHTERYYYDLYAISNRRPTPCLKTSG